MALIECPECGREVSSRAPMCPYCGVIINEDVYQDNKENKKKQQEKPVKKKNDSDDGKKKPRKKISWWVWILVACFAIVLLYAVGYFYIQDKKSEKIELLYKKALESQDSFVIQNFLDEYPDEISDAQRKKLLGKMNQLNHIAEEWDDACRTESIVELKAFIRNYPNNPHAKEAEIKIDSIDWQHALNKNTPEAYRTYMNQHSDGDYYDEAERRIDLLRFTADDRDMVKQAIEEYMEREDGELPKSSYRVISPYNISKKINRSGKVMFEATFRVEGVLTELLGGIGNGDKFKVRATVSESGTVESVALDEETKEQKSEE